MTTQQPQNSSRRRFLLQAGAACLAAPALLHAQQSTAAPAAPANRDTTLKFTADGKPKPFAGNTVICHLLAQCTLRDIMAELHQALQDAPFHGRLGLTSVDSYHMTVFPGANDLDRSVYGWPSYVPSNATIEECSRAVQQRIMATRFECPLPLRMRIDKEATLHFPTAATLRLVPVDAAEDRKIRSLRDRLAEVFGFRTPGHATYAFHMTMSYQVSPFTAAEERQYRRLLGAFVPRMLQAAPVIELPCPEFCTFEDMFRFEPKTLLSCY